MKHKEVMLNLNYLLNVWKEVEAEVDRLIAKVECQQNTEPKTGSQAEKYGSLRYK